MTDPEAEAPVPWPPRLGRGVLPASAPDFRRGELLSATLSAPVAAARDKE